MQAWNERSEIPMKGDYRQAARCASRASWWKAGTFQTVWSGDATRTAQVLYRNSASELIGIAEISEQKQGAEQKVGSKAIVYGATNVVGESARLQDVIEAIRACA